MTADEVGKAYATLGISYGATLEECKIAWKKLSKVWHPDMHARDSAEYKECVEKQKEINQAYDLLKRSDVDSLVLPSLEEPKPKERPLDNSAGGMDKEYETVRQAEKSGVDLLEVMNRYKRLAQMGHAKSQFKVGHFYFDSVMKNLKDASYWWHRAAEQGHVLAQYNLGLMYERGLGVEMDAKQALHWFTEAAKGGDSAAQAKVFVYNSTRSKGPVETAPTWTEALTGEKTSAGAGATLSRVGATSGEQVGRSFLSKKKPADTTPPTT